MSATQITAPVDRHARRRWVEARLLRFDRPGQIVRDGVEKWGLTERTIRRDLAVVQRDWCTDTKQRMRVRRERVLRRLERLAVEARRHKDPATELAALAKVSHLLGMGARLEVGVEVSGEVHHRHSHVVADPTAWLAEFVSRARDVLPGEVLLPALPAPATNGHAGNGHTNGHAKGGEHAG